MTCATTRNLRPELLALDADVTACLAELGETAGRAATSCERRANVALSATHDPRFEHDAGPALRALVREPFDSVCDVIRDYLAAGSIL